MNKENLFLKIINETISDNSYLGDDCACLKDLNLIVSQDTLIEGIHFLTCFSTPYEIGKKAALVNISDILAGGGKPKYLSVSLSGKLDENFVKEFYSGLNEICDLYKIKIIGGDLTGGEKIAVSICILGDTTGRYVSSRKNAHPGDFVYLKGNHGSSAKGLFDLFAGKKNSKFIKAHKEPELYPEISEYISKNAQNYCMMDTSDGVYDALNKISNASGVGFKIDYEKIEKEIEDKNLVLYGGEDFGLLICLNPKYENLAKHLNLSKIGIVTDSKKIMIDDLIITKDDSYDHFKSQS